MAYELIGNDFIPADEVPSHPMNAILTNEPMFIGQPILAVAASALICAISDALGGHYFNRTPVVTDMIVHAAAGREKSHGPLQVSTA